MWQPFVNFWQSPDVALGFNAAAGATTLACGTMFLVGLRLGARRLPPACARHFF